MHYQTHLPSPPLREHVAYLWTLSHVPGHERERIVPSGTIELVVNLHADAFRIHDPFTGSERRFRGAIVSGCYRRAFDIDTAAHALIIGVHFRPGGAGRLLGVPPGALVNDHVGLDDLWGETAFELRERLCAAPTPQHRIALLDEALLSHLSPRTPRRPAVSVALRALDEARIEVGNVAKALGLSRRRFIEIFTEDVGMSPKRYAIVRRFQRAHAIAQQTSSATWSRIALECGYYDQAHLCRDWVDLTGLPPAEFRHLRDVPVKDNHLAVLDRGSNPSKTRRRRGSTLR